MHIHNRTKAISISLFAFIAFLILLMSSQIKGGAIAGYATPTAKKPKVSLVEYYQKLLDSGQVATKMRPIIEEKLEGADMEATESSRPVSEQEQTAMFSGKLTVIVELTLTPEIPEIHKEKTKNHSGLITDPGYPYLRDARFTSGWADRSGDETFIYLAGSLSEDPEQGVIFICKGNCSGKRVSRYYLAEKNGKLKILNAINGKLIMSSKNGKEYRFDMKEKRFENSNGELIPEITATPTLPAYPAP